MNLTLEQEFKYNNIKNQIVDRNYTETLSIFNSITSLFAGEVGFLKQEGIDTSFLDDITLEVTDIQTRIKTDLRMLNSKSRSTFLKSQTLLLIKQYLYQRTLSKKVLTTHLSGNDFTPEDASANS